MATYYVYSAATGAANGASWTDAYTTLTAALTVATAADTVLVASDHAQTTAASVALALPTTPGLRVISTNRGTGLPEAGALVSVGAVSQSLTVTGQGYLNGLTLNSATTSSTTSFISLGASTALAHQLNLENCTLRTRNANASANLIIGPGAGVTIPEVSVTLHACVFEFNSAGQSLRIRNAKVKMQKCSLSGVSATPTSLFTFSSAGTGAVVSVEGCDFSAKSWTTLVAFSVAASASFLRFAQCKFPSGWAAVSDSTVANSWELWILDCASGDTHGLFGYYDHLGSVVSDTATYLTAGAAGQSWKITTTADCKPSQPFITPWIDFYNTGLTAVTPRIECLRNNGTASAYDDSQVFAEFMVKTAGGSPLASHFKDSVTLLGTPAAQAAGVGTGSWTIGSPSSPASFKCDSGASVTPLEVGHIRGRISVGFEIAGTLFVNPQILT